jgi:hypothetical protein
MRAGPHLLVLVSQDHHRPVPQPVLDAHSCVGRLGCGDLLQDGQRL